ncbi:MAG: dihydrolipoyl dehydrogenase [Ectothiorhodospiraceae bacterium]|nr:dihydrolipoyl dehydrogenase [Ectothiorhodospiraceae bacterium]
MATTIEIRVPDIGDFHDVPVIEVLVAPGDRVEAEQALVTLESDKATMDVPAPGAGTIASVNVAVGDTVSEGAVIATYEPAETQAPKPAPESPPPAETRAASPPPTPAPSAAGKAPAATDVDCDVVVIGAGPGGYTAAFRAADLGLRTVLVERFPSLGGVCLNVGCIPSKALLHAAEVIEGTRQMAAHGISFGEPTIDLPKLAGWKSQVVGQLTRGLAGLAKQRKIEVVQGTARFGSPHHLVVDTPDAERTVGFRHAIIAVGSQPVEIPSFPHDDPRVMDSTDALELTEVPKRLLVVGGGIIGLEMATVYHALGAEVSVVELMDQLIPGADPEIVRPLAKKVEKEYAAIYLSTKVTAMRAEPDGIHVAFEGAKAPASAVFDRVLVAVGRRPNGKRIAAEAAGVAVDERGFIAVDEQQRTNVPHIFAIGDVVGQPMLAHKATHEGKVAAEVAAGHKSGFEATCIPSVAYTDPEIAWTGMSEAQAKARGIDYDKATFPWAASGRSLGMGRNEGLTKVVFDKSTGRLIGCAIVGPHAGDLIAEATLAIEMGADATDIGLTVHPHPTLSETIAFAAEMVEGTITDLYVPRKKAK